MIFDEPTVEYVELDMINAASSSNPGGGIDTCQGVDSGIQINYLTN